MHKVLGSVAQNLDLNYWSQTSLTTPFVNSFVNLTHRVPSCGEDIVLTKKEMRLFCRYDRGGFPYFFAAGYNYYGTERLYSGMYGREFEADIFIGVVYYQRLRHMVSDKFQVSDVSKIWPQIACLRIILKSIVW